jgi:hypothetical protein
VGADSREAHISPFGVREILAEADTLQVPVELDVVVFEFGHKRGADRASGVN